MSFPIFKNPVSQKGINVFWFAWENKKLREKEQKHYPFA